MCEPQNCKQLLFYYCLARGATKTARPLSSRQRHRQASLQWTQSVHYLTRDANKIGIL